MGHPPGLASPDPQLGQPVGPSGAHRPSEGSVGCGAPTGRRRGHHGHSVRARAHWENTGRPGARGMAPGPCPHPRGSLVLSPPPARVSVSGPREHLGLPLPHSPVEGRTWSALVIHGCGVLAARSRCDPCSGWFVFPKQGEEWSSISEISEEEHSQPTVRKGSRAAGLDQGACVCVPE